MEQTKIISGEMYFYFEGAYCGMQQEITLDEEVSGEILKEALLKTQEVHPYLTWTVVEKDGYFYYRETGCDAVLLEGSKPPVLGTDEYNRQLVAILYYDNKIRMDLYHGLMDGVASKRVIETLLYYYFSIKDGVEYDVENIMLTPPGEDEGRFAEPFAVKLTVPDEAVPPVEVPADRVFRFSEHEEKDERSFAQYVKVKSDVFMDFVKSNATSPSSAFAVLLSHAIQKLYPDNDKQIRINIPVNLRDALDVPHTFRNTTGDVAIFFDPVAMSSMTIGEQCAMLRSSLKERMKKDNLLAVAAGQMDFLDMTAKYESFEAKSNFYGNLSLPPSDSIFISYVGKINAGSYDKHITDVLSVSGARDGIVINIFDSGGYFNLTMMKKGSMKSFTQALCETAGEFGLEILTQPEYEFANEYVAIRESLSLK